MYRIVLLVLALVAAVIGLLVGTLNPEPLTVNLLFFSFSPPAGVALLGTFAAGLVCGLLIYWVLFYLPAGWRRRRHASLAQTPPANTPGD